MKRFQQRSQLELMKKQIFAFCELAKHFEEFMQPNPTLTEFHVLLRNKKKKKAHHCWIIHVFKKEFRKIYSKVSYEGLHPLECYDFSSKKYITIFGKKVMLLEDLTVKESAEQPIKKEDNQAQEEGETEEIEDVPHGNMTFKEIMKLVKQGKHPENPCYYCKVELRKIEAGESKELMQEDEKVEEKKEQEEENAAFPSQNPNN